MPKTTEPTLAALKRQRTKRLAKLISKAYFLQQRGKQDQLYTLICDEFVSLGGVYVKFLQGVLLNSEIMRKWKNGDRLKIFENLDTVPVDIVGMLQAELKPDQLKQLDLIQPQPFAAGSFGQVYYGKHHNGKPIIIKILRPQIKELLTYDLRLLTVFTKAFVSREYSNVNINLNGAFREFKHATLREADYETEANFAAELYDAYKDDPKIVIPKTYLDLCTKHIIVQDYLDGLSLVDVMKAKADGQDPVAFVREQIGSDLDEQLEAFGTSLLTGSLTLPRIQGDPHPGNIRLLPGNKVGTIDFGISASTPKNRPAFFQIITQWDRMYGQNDTDIDVVALFESFMRFFVNDLYNALKKISGRSQYGQKPTDDSEPNTMLLEVGKIVRNMLQGAVGTQDVKTIIKQGRTLDLFNNVINNNNRLGLVVKLESSEVLRATQTYMSLIVVLGRQEQVFPRMFEKSLYQIEQDSPNIRYQSDATISTSQAFETINSWLERVATRDPDLFYELMNKIRPAKKNLIEEDAKPEEKHA